MAFTIRLCPYCGGDISADEPGYYVCEECGKHTFRSRSNGTAFLANKPYESQFSGILSKIEDDPEDCLGKIEALFEETEEPNADMYFTRGNIYCELGEEGKALIDWKKGLELLSDLRYLDAYIVTVCKRIVKLIVM